MGMFLDLLTILLCAGAMAYCYVLGRQVRALKNMREGVGVLIEDMIRTTHDLQVAFEQTKHTLDTDYEKLNDKIDEGAVLSEYIETLLSDVKAVEETLLSHREDVLSRSRQNTSQSQHTPITTSETTLSGDVGNLLDQVFEQKNYSQPKGQTGQDPLEDVVPKGLGRPIKRAPPRIIPGEEYL